MRTALTWVVLGAAHASIWLLWPAAFDAPAAWGLAAALTSAALVVAACVVLERRDLPAISLASAAGVAVGWLSAVVPAGDVALRWSVAAIGVFVAAAVVAALLAGFVVGVRERRETPPR